MVLLHAADVVQQPGHLGQQGRRRARAMFSPPIFGEDDGPGLDGHLLACWMPWPKSS
jgi:hypothetical protein